MKVILLTTLFLLLTDSVLAGVGHPQGSHSTISFIPNYNQSQVGHT